MQNFLKSAFSTLNIFGLIINADSPPKVVNSIDPNKKY